MSLSLTSDNASLGTDHPILPPELLPNILSFISDPITLATCARLCSGFYSISQSRFFHHVAVDFTTCFRGYQRLCWEERDHPRRSPGKFLSLIEQSPHLIVYVKSLAINTGELPTSFVEDLQLRKILPLLTNLSSVSFPLVDEGLQILNLCQGNHGSWLPYLEVLSPTQNRLITSLNLTFLTNLGSRSVVQLDVLGHYPALKNLTLGPLSSSQCQTGFLQRPSLLRTQHLEALTFDGLARDDYDHTVSWLVNPHCPFSVYRLKTLEIKVMPPNKNYQRVEELMELCHVVENFHLVVVPQGHSSYHILDGNVIVPYDPSFSPPNLSSLPNLKSLTIQGELTTPRPGRGMRRTNLNYPLPWIEDLLLTLDPSVERHNMISRIKIILKVPLQWRKILRLIEWHNLSLILGQGSFPALKRVVIKLVGSIPMPAGWSEPMFDCLRSDIHLSALVLRGVLAFEE